MGWGATMPFINLTTMDFLPPKKQTAVHTYKLVTSLVIQRVLNSGFYNS